jgi:hypothetical protein
VSLRRQKDSSLVHLVSVLPKDLDDSLSRIAQQRADSIRLARDTTIPDSVKAARKAPAAQPKAPTLRPGQRAPRVDVVAESLLKTRPKLYQALVIRVDTAFVPEAKYLVEVTGVRSASGVAAPSARGVLAIPKKPPPSPLDTLRAQPRDSTGKAPVTPPAGDSLKAKPGVRPKPRPPGDSAAVKPRP